MPCACREDEYKSAVAVHFNISITSCDLVIYITKYALHCHVAADSNAAQDEQRTAQLADYTANHSAQQRTSGLL